MKYWRKPLDHDKWKTPKGEIHIIDDRCKGCNFCIEFCPTEVLKESEEFNIKGYHPPEIMAPEKCIGCRLCELICPDFAIYVLLSEEENEKKEDSAKITKKAQSEVAEDV